MKVNNEARGLRIARFFVWVCHQIANPPSIRNNNRVQNKRRRAGVGDAVRRAVTCDNHVAGFYLSRLSVVVNRAAAGKDDKVLRFVVVAVVAD
jgi:hypothetical protein